MRFEVGGIYGKNPRVGSFLYDLREQLRPESEMAPAQMLPVDRVSFPTPFRELVPRATSSQDPPNSVEGLPEVF